MFNAVITWLKHNIEERSQFAKQLLLKVRVKLLSENALKHLSDCNLLLTENIKIEKILKEVFLFHKEKFLNKIDSCYRSRYCNQNKFNLLICGGYDTKRNKVVGRTSQINGSNSKDLKVLASMENSRKNFKAVCLRGEVFTFGGRNNAKNFVKHVEKYSPSTNT